MVARGLGAPRRAALIALLLAECAACPGCGDATTTGSDGERPPLDAGAPPDGARPRDASSTTDAGTANSLAPDWMGVTLTPAGARFRVWAPNASAAWVSGDFNAWSSTASPLEPVGDGTFAGDVTGAAAGQGYRFLLQHGTDVLQRVDPRGRRTDGNTSVIVDPRAFAWQAGDFVPPPPSEQVLYELDVGTFTAGSGSGAGSHGTFASAAAHLDDLARLGVNMIELMPVAQSTGGGWGYGPSNPYSVWSRYGGPDDLRQFVDEAHARGIGVIVDTVHNHYSPRDDLACYDQPCGADQGIYFYADATLRNTPWGPRPDFERAEVRAYILDDVALWLGEYRADGLRWDSVVNIRRDATARSPVDLAGGWQLLRDANDLIDARAPTKIMIAEDLQADSRITDPTATAGAGFDAQWDAGFHNPLLPQLLPSDDSARDMGQVRAALANQFSGRPFARVLYTENHDSVGNGSKRVPELVEPAGNPSSLAARKRSTLGAAVLLTAPGIPMLFMGQELLQAGTSDDNQPLDWSNATRFAGVLQMYQDLVMLRRNTDGHTAGLAGDSLNVFHVNDGAKVIAYHRWSRGGPGDDVIVIANFSGRAFTSYEIGLPRGGTWSVRFNGDDTRYGADFGGTPAASVTASSDGGLRDGLAYHGSVALGPYAAVILSQ